MELHEVHSLFLGPGLQELGFLVFLVVDLLGRPPRPGLLLRGLVGGEVRVRLPEKVLLYHVKKKFEVLSNSR